MLNDHRKTEKQLRGELYNLFKKVDDDYCSEPHIFEKAVDRAMERLAEAAATGQVPPTAIEGLKQQIQQLQYDSLRR